jgi:hypothetical protein
MQGIFSLCLGAFVANYAFCSVPEKPFLSFKTIFQKTAKNLTYCFYNLSKLIVILQQ